LHLNTKFTRKELAVVQMQLPENLHVSIIPCAGKFAVRKISIPENLHVCNVSCPGALAPAVYD